MADVEVRLPQWGMGMEDGVVVQWLRAEGDTVAEGDLLVEIEAAKAVETVESPAAGVLKQILAQPEDVIEVRAVIAIIAQED